ncbi:OstA-like protein [Chitinophaga sp. CF118]|uniref:OstA-like protein n=2 Tax=Pseudomonadati TaxID=3379134 RepID=UPI0008EB3B55|nr:OstA-like protein [Chitinophaga sp. CF118]SFE88253.1 OstA-like protein [Chitinophaga sp. CF118]
MILKMQQLAKYGLILAGICLGRFFPAMAQQPAQGNTDSTKVIHIIQSDKLNVITKDSQQLNRFIGDAIFRQGNTLFYCDSALINRADNVLDAYGHIHINQADSINIYGDYLHYEGDTKLATLRDNARLTDGKITISGPELQYDMNARIGTYVQGGKLVNGKSVLTSQEGFYYADTKDVYFKKNVVMIDPEYTLTTDTLLYNTETKIATIVAPTTINDGKTIMYATSGTYNTESGQGNFDSRPTIEDSTATITADNITMDKATGMAYATGNMVYRDTAQKMTLLSNYGTVNQKEKTILATQHPLMIMEREKDTMFVTADTLFSGIIKKDTTKHINPKAGKDSVLVLRKDVDSSGTVKDSAFMKGLALAIKDSTEAGRDSALVITKAADSILVIKKDTVEIGPKPQTLALKSDTTSEKKDTSETRYLMAWHNVKIFSDSLQGVADSLYYSSKDSIFRFYKQPVLWATGTQLTGDTIFLYIKNQTADKILLDQNGLIVKEAGKNLYNQIKGNQITGYFSGQTLDWMHVDGNAESIYYIKDDDGGFISVNKTLSGIINIYFRNSELHHVTFIKDPEGTMYPFSQRPLDQLLLENFHWEIDRKPKSKYDLIGTINIKTASEITTKKE